MSIDFEEVKKTVLNYEAVKKAHEKAKEEQKKTKERLNEAEKAMQAITHGTSKLTKAMYEKIVVFMNENGLTDKNSYLKEWLQREGIVYQKGLKYKGFEIKERTIPNLATTYLIYKGRHEVHAFWYKTYAYGTVEEAKKGIDIYLEAMKTIPPLMKKLGLNKLSYVYRKAKKETVLSEKHYFTDEHHMLSLMEFVLTFPEVDKWKIDIKHNQCSKSKKELERLVKSEEEYDYAEGDWLCIQPCCKRMKGAMENGGYMWDTFHWGIMQKYDE